MNYHSHVESMRRYVLEIKRKEMKAMSELLLENTFSEPDNNKENIMEAPSEARGTAAVSPKKFESIVNRLRSKVEMARQLRNRSASLVSTLIGSPPILTKDEKEKAEIPTTMLAEVLERIEQDLEENLDQISQSLDKLENAW